MAAAQEPLFKGATMQRLRLFVAMIIAVLAMSATGAFAQNQQRGNFDPAQFRERRMNQIKEQLGASDDEWKVIQPKVDKVMNAQRETFGGGRGFGGRGGGGGGGGDQQPTTALGKASQDLRTTLEDKNAAPETI